LPFKFLNLQRYTAGGVTPRTARVIEAESKVDEAKRAAAFADAEVGRCTLNQVYP
jgi:hypothetical protein